MKATEIMDMLEQKLLAILETNIDAIANAALDNDYVCKADVGDGDVATIWIVQTGVYECWDDSNNKYPLGALAQSDRIALLEMVCIDNGLNAEFKFV